MRVLRVLLLMAISFVNAGAEGAATGNPTLGAPASPAVDDVWIATVHSSDQNAHTFTDWTQIVQGNGGGTTSRISVWYFRYAGSTPNLVVGHTAGQTCIGGIAAYRGVKKTGNPYNTAGSISGGTDASIEHAAITPGVDNCWILACNGSADDNNRSTPPSGYTPRLEDAGGGTQNCYVSTVGNPDGSCAIHDLAQTSATSTGTVTDTQAAADAWSSVLIALEPDLDQTVTAGAPTVTVTAPTATAQAENTLTAGAPTVTITAPAATLEEPGEVLVCGAPVVTVTAPTAAVVAETALVAGAPTVTVTAPTVTLLAEAVLAVGAPTVTLSAPAVEVLAEVTLVTGAPTIVFSAPEASLLVEGDGGGERPRTLFGYDYGYRW